MSGNAQAVAAVLVDGGLEHFKGAGEPDRAPEALAGEEPEVVFQVSDDSMLLKHRPPDCKDSPGSTLRLDHDEVRKSSEVVPFEERAVDGAVSGVDQRAHQLVLEWLPPVGGESRENGINEEEERSGEREIGERSSHGVSTSWSG
ncbi:hypothetical protein EJB05_32823, partial [Eragrostis curvula]